MMLINQFRRKHSTVVYDKRFYAHAHNMVRYIGTATPLGLICLN